MLTHRNEPDRYIGAGGRKSRRGRFSPQSYPVAVMVSSHEPLLDRAILRYHHQTLPYIPYIDGAWVQRVYRTRDEPNLDAVACDDVLTWKKIIVFSKSGIAPVFDRPGNSP